MAVLVSGVMRAPGQDATPDKPDLQALLKKLRDPATDALERRATVDSILETGTYGALLLYNNTRNDYRAKRKAWQRARRIHLDEFKKTAPKALRAKQGRGAKKRIAALQARARRISSSGGLTKQQVRAEADSVHAELVKLLEVYPKEILAHGKSLSAQAELLAKQHRTLRGLWTILGRAADALGRDASGRRHLRRQKNLPSPEGDLARLEQEREWLALLATPMSGRDAKILLRNQDLQGEIRSEEYRGVLALNCIRLRAGLPVLAIDLKLCKASRDHSADMVRLKFFSHTSPVAGKETFSKRAALAGTSASAENIAAGQRTGEGAIRAWWYSPGHHRNMMAGHGRVGLGQHESHWTQMFGS